MTRTAELALDNLLNQPWLDASECVVDRNVNGGITVWAEGEVYFVGDLGSITRHVISSRETVILD